MINFAKIVLITSSITAFSAANANSPCQPIGHILEKVFPIFHQYKILESNSNANSIYAPLVRKIEFEYTVQNEGLVITVIATTGLNESTLLDKLGMGLKDDTVLDLQTLNSEHFRYVEELNYSSTVPMSKTKAINDPGGTDVIHNVDGTVSHVYRPPSTRYEHYTENQTTNHNYLKTQYFNKMEFLLSMDDLKSFQGVEINEFEIFTAKSVFLIVPTKSQLKEINRAILQYVNK